MSYTITMLRPTYSPHGAGVDEQGRAFDMEEVEMTQAETLGEAREVVFNAIDGTGHPLSYADALPKDGGTVGPLPDGTVIEVRRVSADHVGVLDGPQLDEDGQPTISEGEVRSYVAEHAPGVDADAVWRTMESEVVRDATNREAIEHAIEGARERSADTTIKALADVLHATSLRGKPASFMVQVKAADLLGRPIRGLRTEPARVYPIEGDGGRHLVALYLESPGQWRWGNIGNAQIIAAECSCEYRGELVDPGARSDRGACSHLLAALTLARLQGLTIKEED